MTRAQALQHQQHSGSANILRQGKTRPDTTGDSDYAVCCLRRMHIYLDMSSRYHAASAQHRERVSTDDLSCDSSSTEANHAAAYPAQDLEPYSAVSIY